LKYRAKVEVRLKPGYLDPEGESVKRALTLLGYKIDGASVSKVYEIEGKAKSMDEARKHVEEMCRKLLVNPVKDDYAFTIEEVE
jgi:phosphoribosylformylglycinamidine synthase